MRATNCMRDCLWNNNFTYLGLKGFAMELCCTLHIKLELTSTKDGSLTTWIFKCFVPLSVSNSPLFMLPLLWPSRLLDTQFRVELNKNRATALSAWQTMPEKMKLNARGEGETQLWKQLHVILTQPNFQQSNWILCQYVSLYKVAKFLLCGFSKASITIFREEIVQSKNGILGTFCQLEKGVQSSGSTASCVCIVSLWYCIEQEIEQETQTKWHSQLRE